MYVNTPPPIASTMYSIFFFSAMSRIPHITQIDSKFIFTSTVPQANSISLCTISCLISFGKQSSPPDVKSWTTFFTNKFEKAQKNKSYKVFSRFQTDLSLVGLNCLLYIILSQTACSGVFSITFLNCSTVIFAFSAARSIFKSPSRTSCTSIRISPMLMPSAFTP